MCAFSYHNFTKLWTKEQNKQVKLNFVDAASRNPNNNQDTQKQIVVSLNAAITLLLWSDSTLNADLEPRGLLQ